MVSSLAACGSSTVRQTLPGALLPSLGDNVHVESAAGDTSFVVSLRDEAEFWGLMDRLQDLALHLISLHELDPAGERANSATGW
jgi:hypothetical protein